MFVVVHFPALFAVPPFNLVILMFVLHLLKLLFGAHDAVTIRFDSAQFNLSILRFGIEGPGVSLVVVIFGVFILQEKLK